MFGESVPRSALIWMLIDGKYLLRIVGYSSCSVVTAVLLGAYSPTLFIFYLFAYCIHFVRRKSYKYIYFCKIYIFLDLQERKVHSLFAHIFVW